MHFVSILFEFLKWQPFSFRPQRIIFFSPNSRKLLKMIRVLFFCHNLYFSCLVLQCHIKLLKTRFFQLFYLSQGTNFCIGYKNFKIKWKYVFIKVGNKLIYLLPKATTLLVESFAGTNFRDFANCLVVRESLYPQDRSVHVICESLYPRNFLLIWELWKFNFFWNMKYLFPRSKIF